MKRLLLFLFFITSVFGQNLILKQGSRAGTVEDPYWRGGVEFWIYDLPKHDDFPWPIKFTYSLKGTNIGIRAYNEDVYDIWEGIFGPGIVQITEGNKFADYHEPVPFIVNAELANGTILMQKVWMRADCFKTCPGIDEEPEPVPIPSQRYVYINSNNVKVQFDLRACGAISGIWVNDDPVNLIDSADNGRYVQIDMMTGKPCCEDNPWPDIAYRRVETPTQGGGYKQEANYPLSYELTTDSLKATCRMIDYWSEDSRITPWRLDWTVKLQGSLITVEGDLYHVADTKQHLKLGTLWLYGNVEHFKEDLPKYNRWADPNFVADNPIEIDDIELGGLDLYNSKRIQFWLVDEKAPFQIATSERPEDAFTLATGIRYWPELDLNNTNKVRISGYIDLEDLILSTEPIYSDVPEWFIKWAEIRAKFLGGQEKTAFNEWMKELNK